ncbi:MAG: alpha-L-fucosidase [Bacteroidales bacterium]|nr:alpha-L-fucosidase [Bacteroidales bacterium]
MKKIIALAGIIAFTGCTNRDRFDTYEPDWKSLGNHEAAPEWFRDAKLGIYFHWGVYSVPAFGSEWYPRNMHLKESREYAHHLENYGHPSEFGYHDFVPLFKAEHFDAGEWADLFVKAGAKFAGLVAEHHDGFSMWDSDVTPWNAAAMGPKRDVTGELADAFRDRGLKLITTFHHARNLQRADSLNHNNWKSHYPFFKGMPPTSEDEQLRYLYGNIPEDQWIEEVWLAKLKEVVDNYKPDIVWFDSWLDEIPESYRKEFSAYYLNQAQKWKKEVVIVRKQDDLPLTYTVDDLEKSRKNELDEHPWMTDEAISKGSWCYTDNLQIKSTRDVLHVLIDIVSKNGVLLLNISPMADGTIPGNQRNVLLGLGKWLDKYGEAIYGSRPWYTYGEGPTKEPEGHFENHAEFLKVKYSWRDVRYTKRGNNIYCMVMGWPETAEFTFKAFSEKLLPEDINIKKVTLLGSDQKLEWKNMGEGLKVVLPDQAPDAMANVFKVNIR